MNLYTCCDPSVDQEDWSRVVANSPSHAAREYAVQFHESYYSQKGDVTIPVWVKDEQGNETRWMVDRTYEPSFSAMPE